MDGFTACLRKVSANAARSIITGCFIPYQLNQVSPREHFKYE